MLFRHGVLLALALLKLWGDAQASE